MPLSFLCTAPIKDDWHAELSAMNSVVTEFALDGTVMGDDGAIYDGAFITPEAFKLFTQGGAPALAQLCMRRRGSNSPAQLTSSISLVARATSPDDPPLASSLAAVDNALAELVLADRIKWVHLCASGVDVPFFFPLMKACHDKGIPITHCPGVYAVPMAHYCLSHILAVTRMHKEHAANQVAMQWKSLLQQDVRTRTVGIIGAGGIGAEVARLSKAFGMTVLGWRRNATPAPNYDEVLSGMDGLSAVLSRADFVIVSIPKTPATEGLIDASKLSLMKVDAWLINVARGKIIDEAALVDALRSAECGPAGAVIDVAATEPLPAESALWSLPNVTITPHDSWRTDEALRDNHRYWLDNVKHLANGEPFVGIVSDELMEPALQPPKAP